MHRISQRWRDPMRRLQHRYARVSTWAYRAASLGMTQPSMITVSGSAQLTSDPERVARLAELIGYNFQQGSFVYGLEGDWNWIGSKIDETFNDGFTQTSNDLKWLATVRGRAGLAVDATLIYFTGGVAFGHVKNSVAALNFDGSTSGSFSESKTKTGWTAGVGIEYIFSRHWTARAEFRYVDLGRTGGVSCTPGTSTFCSDLN